MDFAESRFCEFLCDGFGVDSAKFAESCVDSAIFTYFAESKFEKLAESNVFFAESSVFLEVSPPPVVCHKCLQN
ncbi:hypothetical protein ACWIUD_00420 [Helicobacter sp. 23-1044]